MKWLAVISLAFFLSGCFCQKASKTYLVDEKPVTVSVEGCSCLKNIKAKFTHDPNGLETFEIDSGVSTSTDTLLSGLFGFLTGWLVK